MERTISNENEVNMVERLLITFKAKRSTIPFGYQSFTSDTSAPKAFKETSSMAAIPFTEARLCINCEHVVRNSVCPMCGSKSHILLGNVLGLIE